MVHHLAGLRPKRDGSYRLECVQNSPRQWLIHNYGHGGAGITLCWGCAEEVRELALGTGLPASGTAVAVLGAGVMGLTAAVRLLEAGFKPTLYTKALSARTTSSIAGGPWSPSLVDHENTPEGVAAFERILRNSFRAHVALVGRGYGVSPRDLYTTIPSPSLAKVPRDVMPEPEALSELPFARLRMSGFRYRTLLIEPLILLARLEEDLHHAGVPIIIRSFQHAEEVAALQEPLVVNCTGLGSREIWPDPRLRALKGQLVAFPPQPGLDYLFSDQRGYVLPRSDGVIIGGTYTFEDDPTPHPEVGLQLVEAMRQRFEGQ